jgi:hypothetical protein
MMLVGAKQDDQRRMLEAALRENAGLHQQLLVQALQDATAGTWPSAGQLAVMAAYAVICAVLATRLFRWQ